MPPVDATTATTTQPSAASTATTPAAGEVKPGEAAPAAAAAAEVKPGEAKPGEAKPAEAKPGEAKPAEAKPGEAKPGEQKPAEAAAFELKAPEGVTLDTEAVTEFTGLVKELNLKPEDAQRVADVGAKLLQKHDAAVKDAISTAQKGWIEQTRADAEFGGEHLDANLAVANKALNAFASPALTELLNTSGLGNHPEVIRCFLKIGKTISEDTIVAATKKPEAGQKTNTLTYSNSKHT